MATNHRSIHLVTSQAPPKQQQPLDAKDIASEVLTVVRDCAEALSTFQDYQETLISLVNAELNRLEVVALRSIAKKARRS